MNPSARKPGPGGNPPEPDFIRDRVAPAMAAMRERAERAESFVEGLSERVPLSEQLFCARSVLERMKSNKSKWTEAQEAVVATILRAVMLEAVTNEMLGRKSQQVEITE